MSEFKNINFVNEFAYRTKLNYFYQKERFAKDENAKEQAKKQIEQTIYAMKKKEFDIAEYYEVTDVINSLIGLLIFPESNVFKRIPSFEKDLKKEFPILYKCVEKAEKDGFYENSYKDEPRGADEKSPLAVINHLRNSLAHFRVMIEPIAGKIGGKNQIVSIVFRDQYPPHARNPHEKFSLKIDVSDLEDVFMEICDYLINMRG